jgi:hypothetical protein
VATEPTEAAPLAWLRDSRDCRVEPGLEAKTLRTEGAVSAKSWSKRWRAAETRSAPAMD